MYVILYLHLLYVLTIFKLNNTPGLRQMESKKCSKVADYNIFAKAWLPLKHVNHFLTHNNNLKLLSNIDSFLFGMLSNQISS